MSILLSLIVVAQVLSALGVIILVLLQHGKGADMGAAFGSGTSGSLFGASGSANFLSRLTAVMATVFFISTLALAFVGNKRSAAPRSVMEQPAGTAPASAPATPASGIPGAPAQPATGTSSSPAAPAAAPGAAPSAGSASSPPADAAVQKGGQGSDIPK